MQAKLTASDSSLRRTIAAVESSLRCFVCALLGLIPLIGLPFAMAAIVRSRWVPRDDTLDWNPADRYLTVARALGPLGILLSAVFLLLVGVILPAVLRDWAACSHGST